MSTTEAGGVQQRANEILSGMGTKARAAKAGTATKSAATKGVPNRPFYAFSKSDVRRASELASEFMKVAQDTPGDEAGVQAALARAEECLSTDPAGLVQHAVSLFATHDPTARAYIKLPSLEQRQPHLVRSTTDTEAGSTPPEDRMDWWREDPLLNDHHGHWHLVYPTGGRPTPNGPTDIGDRHGELFPYMHQQMLARYDAERLAVGLPRVVPFDMYRAPLAAGYDPGELEVWDGDEWYQFRARPAGASVSDIDPKLHPQLIEYGSNIQDWIDTLGKMTLAARDAVFHLPAGDRPVTVDDLGNTEESSIGSVDYYGPDAKNNDSTYGDHHGLGHLHVMYFDNKDPIGVMGHFQTTCRDSSFFRHHKCVDNVIETFRDRQEAHEFDDAPGAKLVSIVLTPSNDELITEMTTRSVESVTSGTTSNHKVPYLTHDDFSFQFTAENTLKNDLPVAVRVFLAPETQIEDRTAWIELDRFVWSLKPGKNSIERAAEDSSVIRKPALKPVDLTPTDDFIPQTGESGWCDCGWPYTLMLPRGTAGGMPFRLLAMLSDGNDLTMPADPHCTSISLCGLKDQTYPDTKPMGYPFDRALRFSIAETVASHENWLWRPITIRCRNLPAHNG